MNFVIEPYQPTAKYASAAAIINALTFYGMRTGVWNRQKPFMDMIDEVNPAAIFTYGLSPKELKYCGDKMIRVVNIGEIMNYIPDVLLFNPRIRNPLFETECVCIASYVDTDSFNNPFLDAMLSTSRTESFKLFSVQNHPKSYGPLALHLQGQALASAGSVLALSEVSKVNAVLCNDNVKVRVSPIGGVEELRVHAINSSNIVLAEEFLPIGMNVTDARQQFLTEAFGCTF